MLQLLGLLLKAIITVAIGIIGFTWEPEETVKPEPQNEERTSSTIPTSLVAPMKLPMLIEARLGQETFGCTLAPRKSSI